MKDIMMVRGSHEVLKPSPVHVGLGAASPLKTKYIYTFRREMVVCEKYYTIKYMSVIRFRPKLDFVFCMYIRMIRGKGGGRCNPKDYVLKSSSAKCANLQTEPLTIDR